MSSVAAFMSLVAAFVSLVELVTAGPCPADLLVVYRLDLTTFWDETTFPKQYPEWRPRPQWSKTVGYTHPASLSLFKLGSVVDEGLRRFVEKGEADILDQQAANKTFLDAILAPPILEGVGKTSTDIFVDGNNTKVSVVTKMVPSPDWFIGLDSVELCHKGQFIKFIKKEAFPLDAGTDNGLTFTSPNWATDPRGDVFTITNNFPSHPAGSFHYPHLDRLPTLAVFSLTKLREYKMRKEVSPHHNMKENDLKFKYEVVTDAGRRDDLLEFVPMEVTTKNKKELLSQNPIMSNEIPQITHKRRRKGRPLKVSSSGSSSFSGGVRSLLGSAAGYHSSTSPAHFLKKKYPSPLLSKAQSSIFTGLTSSHLQQITKSDVYGQMSSYRQSVGKVNTKKKRLRRRKHRRHKKPHNCRVSEWSQWGNCSKSCGIGESVRKRVVERQPKNGGLSCPVTKDFKWCGSARNCKESYFKW